MKMVTLTLLLFTGFSLTTTAHPSTSFGVKNVKLKSFTAMTDGKTVRLTWELAEMEHEVTCFIERSSDGINFSAVSTITINKGFGGLQTANNTPDKPGLYYYRLNMVKSGYIPFTSQIVAIRTTAEEYSPVLLSSAAFTSNQVVVKGKFVKGPLEVQLADMNGQVRVSKVLNMTAAAENFTFSAGNLERGIYIVRVKQSAGSSELSVTKRLVKGITN